MEATAPPAYRTRLYRYPVRLLTPAARPRPAFPWPACAVMAGALGATLLAENLAMPWPVTVLLSWSGSSPDAR